MVCSGARQSNRVVQEGNHVADLSEGSRNQLRTASTSALASAGSAGPMRRGIPSSRKRSRWSIFMPGQHFIPHQAGYSASPSPPRSHRSGRISIENPIRAQLAQ